MPVNFATGNAILQDQLDWITQPPPQPPAPPRLPRDTHALRFILRQTGVANYTGLMFFRPQGVGEGGSGVSARLKRDRFLNGERGCL
jgi:hypothetical protein